MEPIPKGRVFETRRRDAGAFHAWVICAGKAPPSRQRSSCPALEPLAVKREARAAKGRIRGVAGCPRGKGKAIGPLAARAEGKGMSPERKDKNDSRIDSASWVCLVFSAKMLATMTRTRQFGDKSRRQRGKTPKSA